jgi:TrmH family RNA methyltransferase
VFVVEGAKLLRVALDAGVEIEAVFLAAEAVGHPSLDVESVVTRAADRGARVFPLAPGVLERVAGTVAPQPVLAVVRMPGEASGVLEASTLVVVCVDVRDPGNAGAVIRSADAAGADAVVCCEGTADPFNPKTVRASAGSVLHLPVLTGQDPVDALDRLGQLDFRRLAAVARGGEAHTSVDLRGRVALVLGNEASGLPSEVEDLLDGRLTIPMGGRAESLNVATAAAILCFEARRQRSTLQAVHSDATGAGQR